MILNDLVIIIALCHKWNNCDTCSCGFESLQGDFSDIIYRLICEKMLMCLTFHEDKKNSQILVSFNLKCLSLEG